MMVSVQLRHVAVHGIGLTSFFAAGGIWTATGNHWMFQNATVTLRARLFAAAGRVVAKMATELVSA